jgi:C4-dicarboxylate transporter, DctQ subunit
MQHLITGLRRGAEGVAAAMLAAMFATFIAQIAARYLFNFPVGWTVELCLSLWLWLVLWTCAFCLKETDHVKFDLLYQAARPGQRRIFAMLAAASIVVGLIVALPDSWGYVSFYHIKKSATLRIPLDRVFIIYIVFCVALIARYGYGLYRLIRGDLPPEMPLVPGEEI